MATVEAKRVVNVGFPPEEGAKLADYLIRSGDVEWEALTVDARGLPPSLLISAFFNGFLQGIFESRPGDLDRAKKVKWSVDFDFQVKNIALWVQKFRPTTQQ